MLVYIYGIAVIVVTTVLLTVVTRRKVNRFEYLSHYLCLLVA